jgi:hypothetical protein
MDVFGVFYIPHRDNRAEELLPHDIGEANDRIQRRSELVAHRRQKLRFGAAGGLDPFEGGFELRLKPLGGKHHETAHEEDAVHDRHEQKDRGHRTAGEQVAIIRSKPCPADPYHEGNALREEQSRRGPSDGADPSMVPFEQLIGRQE